MKQGITPGVQSGTAGSSPASRSNKFFIRKISKVEAREFMARWHYIGTVSAGSYYAGVDSQGLAAVAVVKGISGVARKHQGTSRFTINGLVTRELSRFALRDNCPKNSESMFLAQLASVWRHKGIDLMLAYADPRVGHSGLIYRASNWVYLGRNTYRHPSKGFFVDGKEVSSSGLRKLGGNRARIEYLRETYGDRFEEQTLVPKHLYVLPLTRTARKAVEEKLASKEWGWFE